MTGNKYEVELVFLTHMLAGYSKKPYDFRIFRRGKEVKVLNKSDENYKSEKERLLKEGYVDMDYIFPRLFNNPEVIDWFDLFSNPIYYIVNKNTDLKVIDIAKIDASGVTISFKGEYHSKTNSPVFYEKIEAGSILKAEILAEGVLKKEVIVEGQLGRYRKKGYGKYRAIIRPSE